ncbi:MAG: NAD(P)H-binding protein [Burkholderiaceae bacterium]|nr:NAD(P)H-binding protein [Burkholderiaceae bacterium]
MATTPSPHSLTLVLGASGKTGRRVAQRLRALGHPVRLGSRSGAPPFEWTQPDGWPHVLRGATAVYTSYQPDLAAPGATQAIGAFTAQAARCGVRRLVLLSGRGEPEAQACEQIVRDSGLEFTLLRASWFAQNFSEGHFVDAIVAGAVELPVADIAEPFIDIDDIADAAVAALTDDRHVGRLYEMTGPRLLTFAQAVEEIARATRRPIRYARVAPEAYSASLLAHGVPAQDVALIRHLFTEVLDGRNASLADGVQQSLGRPARDFGAFVRSAASSGVWNVQGRQPAPRAA